MLNNHTNSCANCNWDKKPFCITYRKAERIYDLGYRKIPENAVVLTREEFSEKIENTWLNCQEFVRKETVEKFAEMAKVKKKYITSKSQNTCEVVFVKDIDEICKEFTGGK